ncbi:MAG: type II secretion system protein F [Clostridium sp.]|nr:type II secretion system protein F [Clostridium sp.]
MSGKEWLRFFLEGAGACGITAYVFYRSWIAFLVLLPAGCLWPQWKRESCRKQRQEKLRVQFKEAIRILASSLTAGYAVENAFAAGEAELRELYGEEGMMTKEFSYIVSQLSMNRPVEALLLEFGSRSGIEEVMQFAEVFAVSKRSRGELVPVVNHVVHVISDKLQVREEILTMTAEKRLEQRVMNLMPYGIVLYVDLTSPGFFSPMYETAAGRLVMTACLLMYGISLLLSRRILRMEWQ